MAARRSDDPVMVAARQLVESLAADPVFVKDVTDGEIERRIAAGLLIPTDRLQLAPGLTLAPTGRIDELEGVLTAILDETDGIPQPLVDKATAMLDVVTSGPALPGAPEADDDDGPEDVREDPVDEPADSEPEAPEPGSSDAEEAEPAKRSRKLPTEPGQCSECAKRGDVTDLDLEQTRMSTIRFRTPLCRPCMANH